MRAGSFWIVIFIQLTALNLLARNGTALPLDIYVYNQAHVPSALLSRAEARVSIILRLSGVQSRWTDCMDHAAGENVCLGSATPFSVSIQIVSGTTKMSDEIFGAAFLGEDGVGRQTDIFYDRLNDLHEDWNISLSELLGNVMAHEIGHLLLGFHAHSPSGIMRPVWSPAELWQAERGGLFFSADQSKLIRRRLERLTSVASGGAIPGN